LYLKTTYKEIKQECGLEISHLLIKCILCKNRVLTWHIKKRLEPTALLASKRLVWALVQRDWTKEDFYNHMFSDDCSAERN
jgi:hypothetical protein